MCAKKFKKPQSFVEFRKQMYILYWDIRWVCEYTLMLVLRYDRVIVCVKEVGERG